MIVLGLEKKITAKKCLCYHLGAGQRHFLVLQSLMFILLRPRFPSGNYLMGAAEEIEETSLFLLVLEEKITCLLIRQSFLFV